MFRGIISCVIAMLIMRSPAVHGQAEKGEMQGNGAIEALSIAERADREIFFETKIRPLLVDQCLKCHNDKKTSAEFNLSHREALIKGGDSGTAIKPGDSKNSLLVQAIERKTDDIAPMPPKTALATEQIADFKRWIDDGAIWPETAPKLKYNAGLEPQEKAHWSFQPMTRPAIPPDHTGWSRTPIDRFVAAGWKDLKPAPDADKTTLLRRLYYDLIGLPPDRNDVEQTIANKNNNDTAEFEKCVELLLNSPRFGERWARHWMDVVRYADTAGDNADYPVPEARFYRDYLIDSFNTDKPFNQLIREQIAGDLMAKDLASGVKTLNNDELKKFRDFNVATTYLGLSRRYATGPFELMHLTLEDSITTTGQAFLGLNFRCARCHDHKYDPITMRDYYGLYSIFSSTTYPYAGSEEFQSKKMPRTGFIALIPENDLNPRMSKHRQDINVLKQQTTDFVGPLTPQMIKSQSIERSKIERDRRLGGMPESVEIAYGVTDGKPHDEPLQRKGEPSQPGDIIPRSVPSFLTSLKLPNISGNESGRRELAEWLADSNNPLTARVYVNRVWMHLFGRGLVETPNDFGTRGGLPSHPELLDYLASNFIENGWSTKKLIRDIVTSRIYQLSSGDYLRQSQVDPENRRLWRHSRRRMDAEAIRDSLLALSGQLQFERPGPHPFPRIETWKWTQHDPFRERYESRHRTVYLMTQRIQKHPFLALFDGPDTNTSTGIRTESSVPLQSLHLANHPFFVEQSKAMSHRLLENTNPDKISSKFVVETWKHLLARSPDNDELQLATELLNSACSGPNGSPDKALQAMIHALFMSNAFLYID